MLLKASRIAAVVFGGFFFMSAIGGFALGVNLLHGQMLVVACMSGGIAVSCGLWWMHTQPPSVLSRRALIMLPGFVLVAGLAFYSISTWILWAAGFPMPLGIVTNGRMGEHWWLGPFTLLYAVIMWLMFKHYSKTSRG